MIEKIQAFFAYPSKPSSIGQCIEAAKQLVSDGPLQFHTWLETDNWGEHLIFPILADIDTSDTLFADITRLNPNVTFEIGYAIARKKRVFLVVNKGLSQDTDKIDRVGIFDTLGRKTYEDSKTLAALATKIVSTKPIKFYEKINRDVPIYILEPPVRSELISRIISQTKKSLLRYRSFKQAEETRLSPLKAIEEVAQSLGVIVTIAAPHEESADEHNIRAAFIAGLAAGMGKELLVLQPDDAPGFLDALDLSARFRSPDDISDKLSSFFFSVHEKRHSTPRRRTGTDPILAGLSLGDPMAENEMTTLGAYFLKTDEFFRAVRGEVNLVVGRKGSGKTALWIQVRDRIRHNRANVVIDLKPEGYQLVKVKEDILRHLSAGAKLHLISAFWEYLIYLEIAYKLLEKDQERHRRDHTIYEPYIRLQKKYFENDAAGYQGDFSERLNFVADLLCDQFRKMFRLSPDEEVSLTTPEVTNLIRSTLLSELRDEIIDYLDTKEEIWVLFDNLDKGWSSYGLDQQDIFMLRCLIEAARKIQRETIKRGEEMVAIIFVRNDIYQLLMKENPDFGKESRATLDWSDRERLRQVLVNRIAHGLKVNNTEFAERFAEICVQSVGGREVIDYLIDYSFMRPRNLIKIFGLARSFAVNFEKDRIDTDDIEKSLKEYSDDVLADLSNELRDISKDADDILYAFFGEKPRHTRAEIEDLVASVGLTAEAVSNVISYLMYYGVLGIEEGTQENYIFDLNYDMKKIEAIERKTKLARYVIHPALWPALRIGKA